MKINGVKIKTPQEMQVTINDIDGETTRNARGDMVRDRIAVKRKISLKFPPLTDGEIQTILRATADEFFNVEYIDPLEGQTAKTFYVSDRTAPIYSRHKNFRYWKDLSFNLIER